MMKTKVETFKLMMDGVAQPHTVGLTKTEAVRIMTELGYDFDYVCRKLEKNGMFVFRDDVGHGRIVREDGHE